VDYELDRIPTDDENTLLDELRRLAAELGRAPSKRDIDRYGRVSSTVYTKVFGSLPEARIRAGLKGDYEQGGVRRGSL
jgi:hypothetical protein